MTYHLTEAAARVLVEIDDAKSAVVVNQGSVLRLLAAGEMIGCMPDTPLRLVAFGFLDCDGKGRLAPTQKGEEAADLWRESAKVVEREIVITLLIFLCSPTLCHQLPPQPYPTLAACEAQAKRLRGEVGGRFVEALCARPVKQ